MDNIYSALNHQVRRNILKLCIECSNLLTPLEVADQLGEHLSTVSYHFRVLEKYGTVILVKTLPRRGSQAHFFAANDAIATTQWVREALGVETASASLRR